jgi:hypothetical protein
VGDALREVFFLGFADAPEADFHLIRKFENEEI